MPVLVVVLRWCEVARRGRIAFAQQHKPAPVREGVTHRPKLWPCQQPPRNRRSSQRKPRTRSTQTRRDSKAHERRGAGEPSPHEKLLTRWASASERSSPERKGKERKGKSQRLGDRAIGRLIQLTFRTNLSHEDSARGLSSEAISRFKNSSSF